jgi:hypothetical protein
MQTNVRSDDTDPNQSEAITSSMVTREFDCQKGNFETRIARKKVLLMEQAEGGHAESKDTTTPMVKSG